MKEIYGKVVVTARSVWVLLDNTISSTGFILKTNNFLNAVRSTPSNETFFEGVSCVGCKAGFVLKRPCPY